MHRTWTSKDKFTYVKAIHKSNYSQQKSLRISSGITPYPIKPSQNMIPKDLNLQQIFTNMIKSSLDLSKKYSSSINNIDIDISVNDFSRKIILKKIKDFFLFYNIEYKIIFKTILLYDIITIENESRKFLSSAEEIALGALILSIKFNYDENKMFSMKKFLKLYGEQVYSLSDIIAIERKALLTISHFLNYTTPMCFLEFFLINGIIYNIDNLNKDNYSKIYVEIENILQNIMEESNNYLKYNFFHLACAIVAFCREKFNLEKWPKTLQKVFSVDFNLFQNEFRRFFTKNENNNNRIYDNRTYNYSNKKNNINGNNNNIFLLNFENLENDNDNDINSNNNDSKSISSRHNYFKNKTNYSNKTIDRYNNIINININNVSFNNIYNNNNKYKNYFNDEQNMDNNSILNRSQNARNFSTVYYNNMKNNYIYKYNISSLQNNLRKDKNKNYEDINSILNNSINLDSELPEIKEEVKEMTDLPQKNIYNSPAKKPKNHFYITKKEKNYIYNRDEKGEEENENEIIENNDNNVFEDYNSNNNDNQILMEIRKKDENNKKESNNIENKNNFEINQIYGKKYRRKYYTYTHKNNIENNNIVLHDEPQLSRNIIYDKYNKKEMNNNLDNSNMESYQNNIIKNNNISLNNNNNINFKENYDTNENENYRYNIIRINSNVNNKLNNEINNKNNFNKNSVIINEKKPYNILISKYLNFNHHHTEKKNLTNKAKKEIKYNISNIVPSNLDKKNQENKNDNELKENSGSSRFRPYRRYNNLINIINDKDDNKGDVDIKIIDKDKNKKKHKGENKIKYNNLIKLKLSKCDSINKRKNIKNNNINY